MTRRAANMLTIVLAVLPWWGVVACAKPFLVHPAVESEDPDPGDVTAPAFSSATIASNGTSLTATFDEAVVAANANGFTLTPSGGTATLTLSSGSGTSSLVFTANRTIYEGETATIAYSSTTGDVEDAAGNDLATFSATSVTNNSTVEPGDNPILATPTAQPVAANAAFSWTPTVLQGEGITYSASDLPAWLNLNTETGEVSGTAPSTAGKSTPKITATNAHGSYDVWLTVHTYTSTGTISQASGFPYYLDVAGRKYTLTEDVVADGSLFAGKAANVFLDLGGYEATYDNATPIAVANGSFETVDPGDSDLADDWDFTNAPNATRHEGEFLYNEVYDGDFSIKFADTTVDEYIESEGTVTLDANTTYSLSGMFELGGQGDYENPGVVLYVKLVGTGGETTRTVSYSNTNWRGIAAIETSFTTGGTAETYKVQVGVTGHASSIKPAYIDDVRIQKTKVFGVAISPKSWNTSATPDITSYGNAPNFTVANGTLTQGQGKGTFSHGIFLYNDTGATFDHVDVTVSGMNSSCALGNTTYTYPATINGCTFTSNNRTITNRDAFDGAVLKGIVGVFSYNTITNGPHAGIVVGGSGSPCVISGNTIQLKAKYTNAFAIIGTSSSQIFNNKILNGSGEFTSHGIGIVGGTEAAPGRIYNNTIEVQQVAGVNQEYQGIPTGGVFGLQFDNSPGTGVEGVTYAEVFDNDVTVYGTTSGYCFRLTVPGEAILSVTNNTFRAVASDGGHCCPISVYGEITAEPGTWVAENVIFSGNTLITNDGICIDCTRVPELILQNTTFQQTTPITAVQPFTTAFNAGTDPHVYIHFRDTTFADSGSRTALENATITTPTYFTADNRAFVYEEWTTTIHVRDASNAPIEGATVTITDSTTAEVFEGTTDANGNAVAVLRQQQMRGTTKTTYNDHTVTVTATGETFSPVTFTADETQTITVTAQ